MTLDPDDLGPLSPEKPWFLSFDWESLYTPAFQADGRSSGPPPKWADSLRMKAILQAIMSGLYMADCAQAGGINRATLFEWRSTAPLLVQRALADAETLAKMRLLRFVQAAAPTQWQAAMTTLERRWPSEWSRRDRVRHEHEGQVGLAIEPMKLDHAAVMALADLEAQLSAGDELLALPEHEEEQEET